MDQKSDLTAEENSQIVKSLSKGNLPMIKPLQVQDGSKVNSEGYCTILMTNFIHGGKDSQSEGGTSVHGCQCTITWLMLFPGLVGISGL